MTNEDSDIHRKLKGNCSPPWLNGLATGSAA